MKTAAKFIYSVNNTETLRINFTCHFGPWVTQIKHYSWVIHEGVSEISI